MSYLLRSHSYQLRSLNDKPPSLTAPSPTTTPILPLSIELAPSKYCMKLKQKETTTNRRRRRGRKRRFHEIDNHSDHETDDAQDIDLNVHTHSHSTNTNSKVSRTIKFTLNASKPSNHNSDDTLSNALIRNKKKRFRLTLNSKSHKNLSTNQHKNVSVSNTHTKQNLKPVLSREASLDANSPILKKTRRKCARIEHFAVPTSHRITRRNPLVCCYEFFDGYRIGIAATLGSGADLKAAIKILSQELVSARAKASIQTTKHSFLVYLKTRKQKLIGCSILHVDHVWKRVNIEMFAVDEMWRGNGFASMMVYLIQYKMVHYAKYDLFVCAANSAVPFWSNAKYKFVFAHKGILEQHEVEDEKHGGTKHMIWHGTPVQARCSLLKCFLNSQ